MRVINAVTILNDAVQRIENLQQNEFPQDTATLRGISDYFAM